MRGFVLALGITVVFGSVLACRSRSSAHEPGSSHRLSARLATRADYLVFVGVPANHPRRWAKATTYTREIVSTADGEIRVSGVKAFIVAYPNGQILDLEQRSLSLPPGLSMLQDGEPDSGAVLDLDAAQQGLKLLKIEFSPSVANPEAIDHYSTTLENISGESIRITSFGAFVRHGGELRLNTVTGKFFSADEFKAWYGVSGDGWIQPSGKVSDPDNYGGPGTVWAYFGTTRTGKSFVSGRLLDPDWRGR